MKRLVAWSVGVVLLLCLEVTSTGATDRPRSLTLEAIFSPDPDQRVEFSGTPMTGLEWLDDGQAYLQPPSETESFAAPFKVEPNSGRKKTLFDVAHLVATLGEIDGVSEEALDGLDAAATRLSPGQDALLIELGGDLFHYAFGTRAARRLTRDDEPAEIARFSPDSSTVAFVRRNDLHVVRVEDAGETALTRDGSAALLNGKLDWVYQEELYGRGDFKGYWWSPDSRYLTYLQLDESAVHEFTLIDHLPARGRPEIMHYPKAGDPNPAVRLGIVPAAGGPTVWVDTSRYQEFDPLIVRVGWTPDSRKVVFLIQDRGQTWLDINLADASSGEITTLVHETSPAFVDADLTGAPHWLADGSFLWLSGRTGFHHLYRFSADGELLGQITRGDWEVRQLHGIDEAKGWVYFSASEHNPIEVHVYRIRLDGKGFQRLSDRDGTHSAAFDPAFRYYLDTWSDVETPPRVFLHRADGELVRTVDANRVEALTELHLPRVEFLQVPSPDGFEFEAALIRPPGFDPGKAYPVLQYNYGGPHAQTVRNAWGGSRYMWFRYLAQQGIVVWMCDNRSASGKGIRPTWEAYGRMGELELADLETCLTWLKQKPWIDAGRIAVYGGSYGGFMASFGLTHSESFKAGIAVAPVTDWRLYDSIYTERYMGHPGDNPEGYEATSVVEAADRLHGDLLLVHGTMDDNVHLQNTIQLADALQQAGQEFQLMLYPNSRHGIRDREQIYHLYRMMTRFLREKL